MANYDQFNRVISASDICSAFSGSVQGRILIGKTGKPLRLFTSDGKPVTDCEGCPLVNITGKLLLYFNKKSREFEDMKGFPLKDSKGRLPADPNFNPEEPVHVEPRVDPIVDDNGNPRLIYDLYGYPLTDNNGRPLVDASGKYMINFDARGQPVCDVEGRQIIDENSLGAENILPLCTPNGVPLRLFDEDKKPLTDVNGNPYKDLFDRPLLVFDAAGVPIKTTYGADIADANGYRLNDTDFDPTMKSTKWKFLPPYQDKKGDIKLIFDQRGFPLTDLSGTPLIDSDGKPLLISNSDRKTLISSDGFDLIEISVKCYNPFNLKSITNSVGRPARIFNYQGKPLTNWFGEPLKHADGRIMIKFDDQGIPLCDMEGKPIYDEYGANVNEPKFSPFDTVPLVGELPRLTDALKNGVSIFDGSGMPLTDRRGFYLINATRSFMVNLENKTIPISDLRGRVIFTEAGLPLIRSLDKEIIGPKGKPCRLFDNKGYPLTCNRGFALKLLNGDYSIRLDNIGRIISDNKGGMIYDSKGVPMFYSTKFNACRYPKGLLFNSYENPYKGRADCLQFYDCKGYPLTNSVGESLVNDKGEYLIVIDPKDGCLKDRNGQPVYDFRGQLHRGKHISSFFPRHVGDSSTIKLDRKERTLAEPTIRNPNSTLDKSNPKYVSVLGDGDTKPKNKLLVQGVYQLFDCNNLPLLNKHGAVLQNSDGETLMKFDKKGRIVSDYLGNDVYDLQGIPLTKVTGYWKTQKGDPLRLFDKANFPLTDYRGKELYDIKGQALLKVDGIGRPVMDRFSNEVYDANGKCVTDGDFDGGTVPKNQIELMATQGLDGKPLIMYDHKGRPLNDENGVPLVNRLGASLAMYNLGLESIVDLNGKRVFDTNGIPFGCNHDAPIETMGGEPYRLFNRKGVPLTDSQGVPLKFANDLCLMIFDMFGRPIQDTEGDGLYDVAGNPIGSPNFRPETAPKGNHVRLLGKDGSPLRLFDVDGRPLTDKRGLTLMNAQGKTVLMDPIGKPLLAPDGGKLYDEYGSEFKN